MRTCLFSAKIDMLPYIFVPSKQQLGASLGIDVGSAAATIMEAGEAQHIVDEVISSISTAKSKKE